MNYPAWKTLHLLFVFSWMVGLWYLPRLFMNLAQDTHPAVQARLLRMARRLLIFMTIMMAPAIVAGLVLWLGVGIGKGQGWLHPKLLIVGLLLIFQLFCWRWYRQFVAQKNTHSDNFFRYWNELPTILFIAILYLVIYQPF